MMLHFSMSTVNDPVHSTKNRACAVPPPLSPSPLPPPLCFRLVKLGIESTGWRKGASFASRCEESARRCDSETWLSDYWWRKKKKKKKRKRRRRRRRPHIHDISSHVTRRGAYSVQVQGRHFPFSSCPRWCVSVPFM